MSAGEAFKNDLYKIGERSSDTRFEDARLDNVRRVVSDVWVSSDMGRNDVLTAFTTAMTELPHKHFYFAALLALLSAHPAIRSDTNGSQPPPMPKAKPLVTLTSKDPDAEPVHLNTEEDAEMTSAPVPEEEAKPVEEKIYIGHRITSHLVSKFEEIVESGNWLSIRLALQFFTLLSKITSPLISLSSLLEVLNKLATTLEDASVSLAYKDECAKIISMVLLLLEGKEGDDLKPLLQSYIDKRDIDPDKILFGEGNEDVIQSFVAAVNKETIVLPFYDPVSEHPELALKPEDAPEPISIAMSKLPSPVQNSSIRIWKRLFDDETVP